MGEDTVVQFRPPDSYEEDPLTEVLRLGARRLLAQAGRCAGPHCPTGRGAG